MKTGITPFMRLSILVVLLSMAGSVWSQQSLRRVDKKELEALYQQIDEAIEESPRYVASRVDQIDRKRDIFMSEKDLEKRFVLAEELFALFKPYKNDSALYYAQVCVAIADNLHRPDLAGRYHALTARQCSNAGMYVESIEQLGQVDKTALDRQGLTDYYNAWMHVCGEIAAYSLIEEVRNSYFAKQDHYRDSLMEVADKGSDEYLHLQMSNLCARQEYQEALRVSDHWINQVSEGTHDDAYASYYRHIVYDKLGNKDMVRYWLAKSALADIKCAVMDQASLITLAELLNYDGDADRSNSYIRFTWHCNNTFNTRLRSSQIVPVLNVIETSYRESVEKNTRFLVIASVVFIVLSFLLSFLFFKVLRQKKRLAKAQADLVAANENLAKTNEKLTKMNDRVMKHNRQLFDINNELRKEKDSLSANE